MLPLPNLPTQDLGLTPDRGYVRRALTAAAAQTS